MIRSLLVMTGVMFLLSPTAWAQSATTTSIPAHLQDARKLVKNLSLTQTKYEHGVGEIVWADPPKAVCDCSGFVNHLLMHSYGYSEEDLRKWFGAKRPTARRFYDTFAAEKFPTWKRIARLSDVHPGDFMAIKYKDAEKGMNTGHIMLIDSRPQLMKDQSVALEGAKKQWQIAIIDSSMSAHGSADTRYEKGAKHTGLGRGTIRVYTNEDNEVLGYTWSTESAKVIQVQQNHPVAIARLSRN